MISERQRSAAVILACMAVLPLPVASTAMSDESNVFSLRQGYRETTLAAESNLFSLEDNFAPLGTPFEWLISYGLTNETFDVEELRDADWDGAKAFEEWIAGTDPTNAASVFELTGIGCPASDMWVLSWSSVNGRWYSVHRSTNLLSGFTPITLSSIPATLPENVYTTSVTQLGAASYRGRVETHSFVEVEAPGLFRSDDVPRDVPDNTTILSTNVAHAVQSVLVSNVTVSVRIDHSWDADLIIALRHPDGTEVILCDRRGGSGSNFGIGTYGVGGFTPTTFDDGATLPIGSGSAPFASEYRPEQSLDSLRGKPLEGTWRLRVTDDTAGDPGTLLHWSLRIYVSEP